VHIEKFFEEILPLEMVFLKYCIPALWKKTADVFAELDDLESADFEILCDQMARSNDLEIAGKSGSKGLPANKGCLTRKRPLSTAEATAAQRLATALDSLGADEEGMYRHLARNLDPSSSARNAR